MKILLKAMDDDELTRLAEEELLREAKRGEAREAVHGVMGWLRDKTPRTNKRFLSNTISNALQHNHRQLSVGTHKGETSRHQNREKLKQKKQADSYPSTRKKDDKKIEHRHNYKSSKLRCNQDSESKDSSSDKHKSGYHTPKRKQLKLPK